MLRDFLADWALRRARKAALTGDRRATLASISTPPAPFWLRLGWDDVARSEWWHDVAAWLDGIGEWPGFRRSGDAA